MASKRTVTCDICRQTTGEDDQRPSFTGPVAWAKIAVRYAKYHDLRLDICPDCLASKELGPKITNRVEQAKSELFE